MIDITTYPHAPVEYTYFSNGGFMVVIVW